MNFTILRFDSVSSTNDEAARQAKLGAAEGVCIVAREQTAGRGRRQRKWNSPAGAGIYFSLILRPKFPTQKWSLITFVAAIAVADALLDTYNLQSDIKWANDIHTKTGQKLAGILAETIETNLGSAVILGIGVNLTRESIAPDLREIAAAIETEINATPESEIVLMALTRNLQRYYQILSEEAGDQEIIAAWTQRSSYSFGKQVCVKLENTSFTGETCGVDQSGALRVRTENGIIKTIYAGDVIALRAQNKDL